MIAASGEDRASPTARLLCLTLAGSVLLGGTASLAGWWMGIDWLTDWWNTGITIKANTAICLMFSAAAVLLLLLAPSWQRTVQVLAAVPALVGALTLGEHATGINLGLDTLLFDERPGSPATAAPGRMGPPAATSMVLLSLGTWLAARRTRRYLTVALPLVALVLASLSIIGYLYGAEVMYTMPRLSGIALQTATMIFALACALLCVQPEREPLGTLLENSVPGEVARRVIPLAIAVPLLLGWALMAGQRRGLFDPAFSSALRSASEILLLLAMLWWALQLARARDRQQREADLRKDRFLATLAHELRNPLAPIRMAATLAKKPQVTEAQRQWCNDVIERQVRHMSLLLDDLLDVSRITRGVLELRRAPTSLAGLIETAVETSRPLVDARRHGLTIHVPLDATVDVDPLRIGQTISNLLNNAAKYTPEGGQLRLSAILHGDDLVIEMQDNGIGIEAGDLEAIFSMFAQIEAARAHAGGGLGIGLALTRGLVELHGGTLTAHSDGAGRGSTFIVRLPGVRTDRPRESGH
jgi:signal transduction histidine kinase